MYAAVMECDPTTSDAVVKDAWPLTRVRVLKVTLPSCSKTAPVGVLEPEAAATVIVKVTPWPKALGFAEELSVTVAASLFTICESEEVLVLKLLSPA